MTARDYLLSLFEPHERVAVLAVPRRPEGRFHQRVWPVEKAASGPVQAWLRHLNASRRDLFLGPNPVRPGRLGRTRDCLAAARRLWLDLDDGSDRALRRVVEDASAGELPPPTHVVRTAPGRSQVVWTLEAGGLDLDSSEALLRELAARYGGDPSSANVATELRWPGFRNWKRGGCPVVVLRSTDRAARGAEFRSLRRRRGWRPRPRRGGERLGGAARDASRDWR